jgi:adenylyl-sulfate kinase
VTWQAGDVTPGRREAALGRVGATVWITGLPAAGKSTLGSAVEARLIDAGIAASRLDGDNLRHGLNGDLAFDPAARRESVRRAAHVALLMAEVGLVAVVSLVSPYAAGRAAARGLHEQAGLRFIEVSVATPLAVCERRDPAGLYARARAGKIRDMTGIDAPYERPVAPELEVDLSDDGAGVGETTNAIVELLERAHV